MHLFLKDSKRAAKFTAIFAHLKPFTDNICLFYKEDGVYIQCMDDSRCCLFECVLHKSWFDEYDIATDVNDIETSTACSSGVNIGLFQKVLAARQEKQTLTLRLTPDVEDRICIEFRAAAGTLEGGTSSFDKFFELPLYHIETDVMEITDFETMVDLIVESKVLHELVNQLTMFDDNISFTFREEAVDLISSGNNGSMKAVLNVNDMASYALPAVSPDKAGNPLKQTYSLRYIQLMAQFNKLAPEVQLGFSDIMPMFMRYNLSTEDEENQSYVRIHLAPKIVDW